MNKPQIIQDVGFDFSWDIEKVWKLDEPVITLPIETLLWHFDIPFWETEWTDDYNLTVWETLSNPDREISHWRKIIDADLSYPIDVIPNKGRLLLLDWLHRLAKSYFQWEMEVKVRIIPSSRIPEILKTNN